MISLSDACNLCGLSLRSGNFTLESSNRTYRFCCKGCQQVFTVLLEATDSGDSASFKKTALFKKCREMGIVPSSQFELEQASFQQHESPEALSSENGQIIALDLLDTNLQGISSQSILSLNLRVSDMWCPSCAWLIDETLQKIPGVVNSSCNFSTDRLRCEYSPVKTSPTEIINSIQKLGYQAIVAGEEFQFAESKNEFIRFAVSAFLTMNVMMLSFALYSGFFSELSQEAISKLSWPIFLMASVVLFYGGRNIFKKALVGFISAASSMETLIAIGSFSAYFYSTFNLFQGSIHLFYDTASMLVTLVLLGKILEQGAKKKVLEDLETFFSLKPTKVKICTAVYPQGRYVDTQQLEREDIFCMEENEIFPADGIIIEGTGSVDESSLTGEVLPITKKSGHRVRSGTKVIKGRFKVKAQVVGENSTLGQMIRIMENALGQKTPLEGKTDRILQWFVPIILALALATGLFGYFSGLLLDESIIRSVTVLVISCPCALGVAIPLARVAGVSLAGKKGILVRDFTSFELAEKVDIFVFDKTGTITKGQWKLLRIISLPGFTQEYVLALAAALEKGSDHYIAMEIEKRANESRVAPVDLKEVKTHENGISGLAGEHLVKIGSRIFLATEIDNLGFVPILKDLKIDIEPSLVYMSISGKLCAVFIFGDIVRKSVPQTIAKLSRLGHTLALVSGDGKKTTKALGSLIGIQEAYGDQLPQDKAMLIDTLRQKGHHVAMVGDGINDAPALARADLAIAVHSGSQLGKEVADITLMRAEPDQILDFLNLARKTNKKVQQNLACSFIYNLVSIPIAMSGLLTPLVAVCAMILSSLSVTGNTLLLVKKFRPSAKYSFR
jgi:heavy metal translocating P-type ATPase